MTRIILARPGDLDILSTVIAEAFHDLPPSPWLISDEAARRRIFPGYFRLFLEHALTAGTVHTTPARDAAALWIPVGNEQPGLPDGYLEQLATATEPWTQRFIVFDAVLESRHLTGQPHHHLALLAVRPGRQGRGTGTALLRFHHRVLDRSGKVAYLEASSQRNRELYLRHGYSDIGPSIDLPGGPSLFPMVRQPHLATTPSHVCPAAQGAAVSRGQRDLR